MLAWPAIVAWVLEGDVARSAGRTKFHCAAHARAGYLQFKCCARRGRLATRIPDCFPAVVSELEVEKRKGAPAIDHDASPPASFQVPSQLTRNWGDHKDG